MQSKINPNQKVKYIMKANTEEDAKKEHWKKYKNYKENWRLFKLKKLSH